VSHAPPDKPGSPSVPPTETGARAKTVTFPKPPPRLPPSAGKLANRPIAELSGGVVQGARGRDEPVGAPPTPGLPPLPRADDAAMANLDLDVDLDVETTISPPPAADRSLLKPPPPANQLPAICTYGRYEILGRIAFGGMAEIFLGRENLSVGATRMLVIKRILPQVADDPAFVEMFLDEARLAIQLSHPNICHIYEFGEIEGTYFIAMEWIHGAPLGKVIRRARDGRAMAPELVVKILVQVAEALEYAHNARDQSGQPLHIVHRDVTPHNIMVSYGGQVKLLDFGIAKATSASTKTEAGVVKGKFAYMSPQQCLGRDIDARSDVFALGICLYEALTGRSLYQRDTDYETMKAVIEEPVPSIRATRPELPMELDAIVQRALQKSADDRWASAGQMQQALEDWLASIGRAVPASKVADLMTDLFREEVLRGPLLDSTPFGQSFKRVRATEQTAAGTPSAARALQASSLTTPADSRLESRVTDPDAIPPVVPSVPPPAAPSWGLRIGLGLAALALLVGVGGGAWYLGRNTPVADSTPHGVVPATTTVAPVTTPTPPVTAAPPTTTEVVPEVAAPTPGRVVVHVDVRGASVRVDDHTLSSVELESGWELPAGHHVVHVEHPERRPYESEIDVVAGAETVVDAHLEPRPVVPTRPPGLLSIDTRPWSKVYVGSRLLGTTPIAEAEVQSGSVRLRIVDRDGRTFTRTITVPPNQEHRVFYNLDE
jgi:serine/threonine protein kinase